MTSANIRLSTLLAILIGGTAASAAEGSLGVGDPAPPLKTGKWVQGEAITRFEKDKAYLVEFWATWCGPCRTSIPHLNKVHLKFKDKGLVVIGQDVWEPNESQVQPFVQKMGDNMTYRVALDDKTDHPEGAMAESWMKAAGQSGIPTAFLVGKDGKIAWIGHPTSLNETTVEQVLAGQFDVAKATALYKQEKEAEAAIDKAWERLTVATQAKKWDDAEAALTEIMALLPEGRRDFAQTARIPILLGKGDLAGAATLATKLADQYQDDATTLNYVAWGMVTQDGLRGKALDAAYDIAVKANVAAEGKDASILDTLARAVFLKGEKAKAVELQAKAVALAEGDLKKQLEGVLDSYKAGKLPPAQ